MRKGLKNLWDHAFPLFDYALLGTGRKLHLHGNALIIYTLLKALFLGGKCCYLVQTKLKMTIVGPRV